MARMRRRAAAALAAGVLLPLGATAAHAAMTAGATATPSVTSGSWGVSPTGSAKQAQVLTWTQSGSSAPLYFTATNTGTVALAATTWTMQAVRADGIGNGTQPVVTLDACVGGTWNTTTNVCTGGTGTTIGGTTSTNASMSVASSVTPVQPGSALAVRATLQRIIGDGVTATISTTVSSSQILSPKKTTNS
jgi:hypothetical protein